MDKPKGKQLYWTKQKLEHLEQLWLQNIPMDIIRTTFADEKDKVPKTTYAIQAKVLVLAEKKLANAQSEEEKTKIFNTYRIPSHVRANLDLYKDGHFEKTINSKKTRTAKQDDEYDLIESDPQKDSLDDDIPAKPPPRKPEAAILKPEPSAPKQEVESTPTRLLLSDQAETVNIIPAIQKPLPIHDAEVAKLLAEIRDQLKVLSEHQRVTNELLKAMLEK